ncbi:MAG TPA: large subunit of N,N-dimethylformamidase [Gammaproteobacteria bacterium]|nr:large subunit of N,N-dimethylformamidase [Gammaproteobacteria bacterium]HIL97042.1 large subunit of N,N-dimethylformamidase [Pseudomonadales bacterium]
MEAMKIVGYLTPLCTRPGDEVSVKISCETGSLYHASLIELICGDSRSHGTGYQERSIEADFNGEYPGKSQPLVPGSYASLGELPASADFGFSCWFYPTLPAKDQLLLSGPDLRIRLLGGQCLIEHGGTALVLPLKLRQKRWHQLSLSAADGCLRGRILQLGKGAGEPGRTEINAQLTLTTPGLKPGQWWLATDDVSKGGQFNGRIEAPLLTANHDLDTLCTANEQIIARWDFSRNMTSDKFSDIGEKYFGEFYQQPTRAVTGVKWDSSVQRWTELPEHYAAVHFHDDDLIDAGWETDFSFRVPVDLDSGVYAVKVRLLSEDNEEASIEGNEDIMPFFVSPGASDTKRDVALLMSTATYLAYANQRLSLGTGMFGKGPRNPFDKYLLDNPEVGNSLYEHHSDGSGVHFSSRLRPILNLKPKTLTWSFNADTNLTAWLKAIDQPFDVITDEQLHYQGIDLLKDYRVVITGTHPEYHSTSMMDGIFDWMDTGGRLMYMGGNGFYWRIAHHPNNPAIIEVRRAEDGTRAWMSEAGEYYHQFTGEYGGLWRRLGRPPNELVGVGFTAQGFDGGTHYRLSPESLDPRVSFITEGINDSDTIGDYGTQGGGAAGEEIDRYDTDLGSPKHAIVIASSEEHRPGMLITKEEFLMTVPVPKGSDVRADMTFFETPSGGAVFSTGSISYAGALSVDGYENDIAKITLNVLNRFLDPALFDHPSQE